MKAPALPGNHVSVLRNLQVLLFSGHFAEDLTGCSAHVLFPKSELRLRYRPLARRGFAAAVPAVWRQNSDSSNLGKPRNRGSGTSELEIHRETLREVS